MKTPLAAFSCRLTVLACLMLPWGSTTTHGSDGDVTALLARARSFLGGDTALHAVRSLRFLGTVTSPEGKTHKIELMVRRPLQQCLVETADDVRVTTGLNDYTAWRRVRRTGPSGTEDIALLSASDVRRLRANTWQNLYFYHQAEVVDGHMSIEGEAEIDGVGCWKTRFAHSGGIAVIRYFEKSTGRLVMTRTDDGAEARESGVIEVAGIRFAKELTTTMGDKSSKLVFDDIRVNEEFDDALFATPRPQLVP